MSEERGQGQANPSGEIKSAVQRAGATMQDTANKLAAETSELGEQVYEQAARGTRYVSNNIEAQPLAAMAIVGAVGFVLGLFVGRRS